jgi:hypothetical protein
MANLVPLLSLVEEPTSYGFKSDVRGYTWYPNNQMRFSDLSRK